MDTILNRNPVWVDFLCVCGEAQPQWWADECACFSKAISNIRTVKPVCHIHRSPSCIQVEETFRQSCETTVACVMWSVSTAEAYSGNGSFPNTSGGLLFACLFFADSGRACMRLFLAFAFTWKVGRLPRIQRREGSWMEGESCWRRRRVLPLASEIHAGEWGSTTGPLRWGRETKRKSEIETSGQTTNSRNRSATDTTRQVIKYAVSII